MAGPGNGDKEQSGAAEKEKKSILPPSEAFDVLESGEEDLMAGAADELGARTDSLLGDCRAAALFLTRVPLPGPHPDIQDVTASARAWPLIGAVVGLAGALVFWIAAWIGLGPMIAAVLGFAATMALTGAMHEDGLSDFVDGFGGTEPGRRLEIMRDSRIGAFGVLALIVSVLLRVGAVATIAGSVGAGLAGCAMIAAAAGSRGVLPTIRMNFPNASTDGMAASGGMPPPERVLQAIAVGLLLVFLFLFPWAGFLAALTCVGAAWVTASIARRALGGVTGDVLGACQQTAEIAILLTAAVAL